MQQILAIHGGTTYKNYDDFLRGLATKPLHPERFTFQPMWKELLQQNLGSDYRVLLPSMPNKTNARYSEWKIWFDHLTEIIEDDVILIGHSLGAIFLAKYLSENEFSRKIKATILVATPYDDETTEDLTDFKIETISEKLEQQAGELVFFQGIDDPVIASDEIKKYQAALPSATFNLVSAPDHFVRPDFPEIIDLIINLQ